MKKLLLILAALIGLNAFGQQINIGRIDQMPDFPQPYLMRDWKRVALEYDSLIYSQETTGDYMPMLSIGSSGINYPDVQPIFLDSYVGSTSHGSQQEAINIIPSLVGASLVGADKRSQFNTDWVIKAKDFFGLKSGELVYLNGPSDHSGNDWWYETMPNVFFYQLYDQYPGVPGFDSQFTSVANRWLQAVEVMGASATPWQVPNMDYRSWSLTQMQPGPDGVREPEASGAIAWILYQAYRKTGDKKYLTGAQWALDFLDHQTSNPSYELQLSYGVLTAALLNAELGTDYDLTKMVNWCFDRGPLRGWGSVIGNWGGMDVAGLIGEANDQGDDYVFVMNGYQQASTLLPMVKYDKRFAGAIAKWALNLANASRLFYSKYLPSDHQSDYDWSSANDPNSAIAYEAIKQKWNNVELYGRGDAKGAGWGATNLGIYGSSHVGYLGAVIDTTDVEGILMFDLNATDFFSKNPFSNFLVRNPYAESKTITIDVGNHAIDIYDAIQEKVISQNVSGVTVLTLSGGQVMLLTYIPAGSTLQNDGRMLTVGEDVVDYHYGNDFTPDLVIKALSSSRDSVEVNQPDTVYCAVNLTENATYKWYVNDQLQNSDSSALVWSSSVLGEAIIKVQVKNQAEQVVDSLKVDVVELIPEKPVIDTLEAGEKWVYPGDTIEISATAHDPKSLPLDFSWKVEQGTIESQSATKLTLIASNAPGIVKVTFTAKNGAKEASANIQVLIAEKSSDNTPLVYLPLNGNALDASVNQFQTKLQNGTFVADPRGESNQAIQIASAADELIIKNNTALNFKDAITVSFWAYFTDFSDERFVISHGSWEERWKVSTITDRKLRWTINTTAGVKDLDGSALLKSNEWNHYAVVYTGKNMQLYVNGQLDTFTAHSGSINVADVDLSVGKRLPGDTKYILDGNIDEVKIFDHALSPDTIASLMNEWMPLVPLEASDVQVMLYPNPSNSVINISGPIHGEVTVVDLSGNMIEKTVPDNASEELVIDVSGYKAGIYLVTVNGQTQKLLVR